MSKTFENVLDILVDILEDDEIELESILSAHGDWDSLTALTLISTIDEDFDVFLEADDFINEMTINDLVTLIVTKIENK